MRVPVSGLLLFAAALALLGLLLATSADAQAVGEEVRVLPEGKDVIQTTSVPMEVFFGAEASMRVEVTCPACSETWIRSVSWDNAKSNCGIRGVSDESPESESRRFCRISFPEGFHSTTGKPDPANIGEPAHRDTYTVRVGQPVGPTSDSDTFDAWMASAQTCREHEAWRSDIVEIQSSGHGPAERVNVRIVDLGENLDSQSDDSVVAEFSQPAFGPSAPVSFQWTIPLQYPLGPDKKATIRVELESPSKTESETFELLQASPTALVSANPGLGDQPSVDFNRTEKVRFWFRLVYLSAPPGCPDASANRRVVPVPPDLLPTGALQAQAEELERPTGTVETDRHTIEVLRARYVPALQAYWLNWTIPRDVDATDAGPAGTEDSPQYRILVPDQELKDGNKIRPFQSNQFLVHPYDILPRVKDITLDVERLETARVLFNITYGDGSPFTPRDASGDVDVELRRVGEQAPVKIMPLNHLEAGLWNASFEVDWEYEDLGDYRWVVQSGEDRHGDRDERNRLVRTATQVFQIVGARPVIDFHTIVEGQEVNGTQRTKTVHAMLTAVYKNGLPLTENNVDSSLGGVVLNVKKTDRFGRTVDVDRLVMTDVDNQGSWVRTFRLGRTVSEAPVGDWDLEVIAGDDSDPTNRNTTSFPFRVDPAKVVVSPVVSPPNLVNRGDEDVHFRARLTYPDGTLLSSEQVDPDRGGELTFRLTRVTFLNETEIENEQRPRPVQGGPEWEVRIDPATLVPGAHTFNVTGQDIHGNPIGPFTSRLFTVLFNGEFRNSTTPICPGGAGVPGGPPACSKARGEAIFALFPKSDGDTGLRGPDPRVQVFRKLQDSDVWVLHDGNVRVDAQEFGELTGRNLGEHHAGYFQTDQSTPVGTYQLFVLGRAADDTGFAGFSVRFNITAVEVDRKVLSPMPSSVDKGQELVGILQREPGDVVDEAFVDIGPVRFRNVETTPVPTVGTFVRWTPPRSVPSGDAVFTVIGQDLFGNRFEATLGPVKLKPSLVNVGVLDEPPVQIARGDTVRMEVRLTFEDGAPYTSNHGRPTVSIQDALGRVVAEGDSRFNQGRWVVSWRPTVETPAEPLHFHLEGEDANGNRIQPFDSRPFRVVPGSFGAETREVPESITRGQTIRATLDFPAPPTNVSAVLTTGTTDLGAPTIQTNNNTVELSFPTDRTTDLVLARFEVTGRDVHGNDLEHTTRSFRINPQRLDVRFLTQPPGVLEPGERFRLNFAVEYPDGTRLNQAEGIPIVGLFSGGEPRGPIRPQPHPSDPTVWQVEWTPPKDVSTEDPFRFAISGLDRWQNEIRVSQTPGFYLRNPVVPDYFPVPWTGPATMVAVLVSVAAAAAWRREP